MGEHDQTALTGRHTHGDDTREGIHDDGRTLGRAEFEPGAGGGAEDFAYNDTPVFRYSHDKLIPDTVHVHLRPFSVTKWESMFSTLFGSGTHPDNWVCPSCDPGLEPTFRPVIDDSYRVVGHLGWISGTEICLPKNTVAWDSRVAHIFEERRLGEDRRRLLAMHDRDPFPPFPGRRWAPEPDTKFWAAVRRGPLKDASEEQRHQNNINYFLAGGGTALVGRDYVHDQMASQNFDPFLPGDYRCMALVRPDGYLQSVLMVEKILHESRQARGLRIIFEVIDIALTVWMIIDIATISVGLIRLGVLLARAVEIRAIQLAVDQGAKAALKLAEQEARALSEVGVRGAAKAAEEFAVETIVIDAKTEARWAARGARLRVPEGGGGSKAVGELWREGAAEAEGFSARSGPKGPQVPRTELTQPPRHVMKPEPIEDLNKGIPDHVKDASPAEKRKWIESPEGKQWRETKRLDGPSNTLDTQPPHAGPRDHDAEANMFERIKAATRRDTVGELHFKVDRPVCPACKDMLFRFAKERPRIKVIQHSLDNKLITP